MRDHLAEIMDDHEKTLQNVLAAIYPASIHYGLKVRTIFSPGNVDLKNVIIFDISFNIRGGRLIDVFLEIFFC